MVQEAKEAIRNGQDVRNLSLEDSDGFTRKWHKRRLAHGFWDSKFIWVGLTEIKVQRVQFVKDCALKGFVLSKQILRSEALPAIYQGSVVNTITIIRLSRKSQGAQEAHFFFSSASKNDCTYIPQSKNVLVVTATSGSMDL